MEPQYDQIGRRFGGTFGALKVNCRLQPPKAHAPIEYQYNWELISKSSHVSPGAKSRPWVSISMRDDLFETRPGLQWMLDYTIGDHFLPLRTRSMALVLVGGALHPWSACEGGRSFGVTRLFFAICSRGFGWRIPWLEPTRKYTRAAYSRDSRQWNAELHD